MSVSRSSQYRVEPNSERQASAARVTWCSRCSTVVPIAPCQLVAHPGVPADLSLLSMTRVRIPTVVDVDRLPEWAGEVGDRQLGLHEGRWVAYDLGDTTTA